MKVRGMLTCFFVYVFNYELLGLAKKYRTWELKYYIVGFRNSPMSCEDPEGEGGGRAEKSQKYRVS